jgi:cell division protein FtsI/penicillin-binding protein 2
MQSRNRNRAVLLVVGMALFAAAIAARLVWLQAIAGDEYRGRAARQQQQTVEIAGRRGAILDRHGRELAVSVTTESLYVHPKHLENPTQVAKSLSPILGIPASRLEAELTANAPFRWLARRLEPRVAEAIRALPIPVGPGRPIDFQEEPRRYYPQGSLGIHVVGFTDIDQKGLEGIESRFDELLEGAGSLFLAQRDGRGGHVLQLIRPPLKQTRDVVLTIDLVLQHLVERELDAAMRETGAQAATAVVLDPATGQILAMANRPTFDPARVSSSKTAHRRNRAVTDLYEPGSTFKTFTAAIALDEGRTSPESRYDCSPRRIHGKLYQDVHRHGVLSLREILEQSSNVGILQVGGALPRDLFRDRIVRFGFGAKTGAEVPGEAAGRVTPVEKMSGLSTVSMSMGYEIQVTALQVAAAMAAVANDGVWNAPRIVLGTRGEDGSLEPSPAAEPHPAISPRTAVTLANMLEGVVVRGTGTKAAVPGYRVAGKTGTSRKIGPDGRYSNREYMASFAGFAPVSSPRLAGVVVLDTPSGGVYYGGLTAAPVLGKILADALVHLRVPADGDPWKEREEARAAAAAKAAALEAVKRKQKKDRKETKPGPEDALAAESAPREPGPGEVPAVAGRTLRETARILASAGYTVRAQGSGVVLTQTPEPGTPVPAGTPVLVVLGAPPREPEDR